MGCTCNGSTTGETYNAEVRNCCSVLARRLAAPAERGDEAVAFDFFNRGRRPEAPPGRLPPGQYLTKGWPVLHYGDVPRVRPTDWTFRVWGLVENPQEWNYEQFLALGHARVECDVHCVTRWSKFDNVFEGVPFRAVLEAVKPKPEAQYVMVHAEKGFTANVPLADLDRETVLVANKHNDKDL